MWPKWSEASGTSIPISSRIAATKSERYATPLSVMARPVKGCITMSPPRAGAPAGTFSVPGFSWSRLTPKSTLRNVRPRSMRSFSRRPWACPSSTSVVSA